MKSAITFFFKSDTSSKSMCRRISLCLLLLFFLLSAGSAVRANNVQLPGVVKVTDVTAGVATLEIDVTWDNSWRDNFNWDAVWLFLKVKPANGVWSHVMLQDVAHTASGDFTVMNGKNGSSGSNVVGVYVLRSKNAAGNASTKVTLKYNCGSYTKADFDQNKVFLLAQGIEMVYVPFGAYYLGDGRSNRTLCDASGNPVVVNGEEAVTLSQRSAEGVVTSAVASLPAAYPKGYNGYYVMKYELSQEQYVTFLNLLNRSEQETLLGASKLSALSVGDYLFGTAGTVSNRNGIILKDNPSGKPYIFANNLNGNAVYGEDGDGQYIACNYLSINDMIAYASWSGLRPMSELEYERACRAPFPQEPLPGEYVWSTVGNLTKATSFSAGGKGSELASAGSNVNCGGTLPTASRGPMRCGIFATSTSNQITAGSTYWGVMEMGGNVKELVAGVANTGLARTTNGGGVFSVSAWSVTPAHYGVRGGGFTSPDSLLRTSDRSEATGYFSDAMKRDSTVGFRLTRTLDAGSVTVSAGAIALTTPICPTVATVTETAPASVTPANGMPLTYVWSVKEGSGAFTVIHGETGSALTYNNIKDNTVYQFKRKVVCQLGEAEASSAAATSLIPVKITTQPVGVSTCIGDNFTLTVAATGSGLTYQWMKDGSPINSATGTSYVNNNFMATNVGVYTCVVGGSCNGELSSPASVLMSTTDGAMTDPRDKKVYATRVMADGREWMIEDLKFGICNASTFKSYNQGNTVNQIAQGYYGVCITSTQRGAGYLYNWQAAMNSADAVYNTAGNPSGNVNGNSPTQWQGICPPGWHLPSGGSTGELQQLYTALGNDNSKIYPGTTCDGWRGVFGGISNGSSLSYAGISGHYWSSTFYSSNDAYRMSFSSGSVRPQSTYEKFNGLLVRCIKNY